MRADAGLAIIMLQMFQLNRFFFQEWQLWDQRWYLIHLSSHSSCCGPFHMVSDQQKSFLERHVSAKHSNKHRDRQAQWKVVLEASQNGRGRTSEKSVLPKSHEKTGRKFQNQCFQNSGNSPKACNNLSMFIPEKQMNPSRKSEPCGFLTGPIPMSLYPTLWYPWIWIACNPSESQQPGSCQREQKGDGPPAKFHFQRTVINWSLWLFPGWPHLHGWLYSDWLRACPFEAPFPWEHLSKTFRGNCLTLQLPQAVGNTWGEQ